MNFNCIEIKIIDIIKYIFILNFDVLKFKQNIIFSEE